MKNILEIKDLKVEYFSERGVIPALRGVSLTLRRGECIGVVGESGCGKSTLALALLDIIDRTEGRVYCSDIKLYLDEEVINLRNLSKDEMRSIRGDKISLILQDPYNTLNPVIKIGKQLKETYSVHHPGSSVQKEIIEKRLKEVHLPYESIVDLYPHQLSGGMLQRVSIAMALLNSPEVLIADEPTSNLDVTIQKKIIENLKILKEKLNLSLIFISHNLNLVSEFADRIYILYAGKFVEYGASSEIFTNPLHPYTKGLLNALPDISKHGKKISPISGNVPDPLNLPEGCSFAPRCKSRKDECLQNETSIKEVESGHFSRCIY